MRFRNSRLRTKIAALLVSLAALWVFAAWVTLREGLNLLTVSTLDQNVTRPAVTLVTELQQERRLSMIYLGSPGSRQRTTLDEQRHRVDAAAATYRKGVASGAVSRMASDNIEKNIKESLGRLNALATGRRAIDTRSVDRSRAAEPFNDFIDAAFRLYSTAGSVDDQAIAKDSRTLNALTRAKEILSREDALLAGVLATSRFTPAEHAQFVQLVGTQRFLHEEAAAELPPEDSAQYDQVVKGDQYTRMRALEDRIIQSKPGAAIRITPADWLSATEPVQKELEQVVLDGGDRLLERAKPMGYGIILRLALAGGLGLIAVIASVIVSITTARALVRQLERLRGSAWELAEQRLPGVVERLGHGENVDVSVEAPPLEFGADEIGQVGRAFNAVQETAIRTAVEQAELRRGIRDVLLSLARRTQTLVHRQLTMLDTMERRRDIEVKELEELFRLDHLATRMRRNAENLIVLSGALPARGWRNSVPMVDVVRAAVGEVEDYTRVTVLPFGPVELAGRAVGDITHLLAELIENAVSFSPPDTVVQVGGHLVASGFAIDIEDRGLGMTDDKLTEINERIADPPDFNLQSSVQLGLFVVSRLAERYNVQVSLKRSAYGGTTAVIVVPRDLIVEQGSPPVAVGATTQNGLEVRRPAAVGVAAGGRSAAGDSRSSGSTATLTPPSNDPQSTGPQSTGPQSTGPQSTGPQSTGPQSTGPQSTGPQSTGPALVAVPPPASEPSPSPPGPSGGETPDGDVTRSHEDFASGDGEGLDTIQPEDLPPVSDSSTTPSGLPVRVPQANLAEPLRNDDQPAAEEPEEQDDPGRSPEEIKRIMGSYQRGSQRGRSDAALSDQHGSDQVGSGRHDEAPGTNPAEGEEDQ